jgi:hypothetical protein
MATTANPKGSPNQADPQVLAIVQFVDSARDTDKANSLGVSSILSSTILAVQMVQDSVTTCFFNAAGQRIAVWPTQQLRRSETGSDCEDASNANGTKRSEPADLASFNLNFGPWTKEEDAELIAAFREKRLHEFGQIRRRSREQMRKRLRSLGVLREDLVSLPNDWPTAGDGASAYRLELIEAANTAGRRPCAMCGAPLANVETHTCFAD